MDVRQLAPALLALQDLFQEANVTAFPGGDSVALEVRSFRQGSFDVVIQVVGQAGRLAQQSIGVLNSQASVAGATLITFVTGALALIQRIRGRKVSDVQSDSDQVVVTLNDNTQIHVHNVVFNMYQLGSVRKSARGVVRPLKQPGIETLRISAPHIEAVTIGATDVEAFEEPIDPDPVFDETFQAVLTIAALSFVKGNKWRFRNDNSTFWASIEDEEFWSRVESAQEAFTDGDLLRCILRVQRWVTEDGFEEDATVVRVLEHIPGSAPQQWTLPL